MNKTLLIGIGVLAVAVAVLGFLFLGQEPTALPNNPSGATSSPFGLGGDNVGQEGIPATQPDFEGEVEPLPEAKMEGEAKELALFKLEATPIAGFVALSQGTTTFVRFADRTTGNIFDARVPSLEKKRVTNNTLPQIYEAYFRDDGAAALFRSLDESDVVKNMGLMLTPPRATSTDALYIVSLTFFRGQIDGVSKGAGNTLFYTVSDSNSVVSSQFDGGGVRTLWSGPFTSWRTGKLGTGTLLFTKPSVSLAGYAYRLSSGSLAKLLGPLNGLVVTANPGGTHLIYSYASGSATRLFTQELGKPASTELSPSTLADKCVGSVQEKEIFYCGAPIQGISGNEPDRWYEGKSHFSDSLWRFNAVTGGAELVLNLLNDFGVSLDISSPQISLDGKYFFFINKSDLSLWAAKLK